MLQKIIVLVLLNFVSCEKEAKKPHKKANYASYHTEAKAFCRKEKFNEDFYFLVDLSVHSGKNRFYVYDLKTNKLLAENLATHGSCDALSVNETKWQKVKFSNTDNSHCSSKGKYKIGKRAASSWGIGIKYWLHGLESTNSNAENRVVVLHSWSAVANKEIYPKYSPLSWGCPAVSDDFMELLDAKLQKAKKPVLLWIVG